MIEFRLATNKDYQNINDFYNRIHGSNRTMEQFLWQFQDGPAGKAIYIIGEDGDRIIGTNCVIPIELKDFNENIILSGKSEDTLVDPEYRGQNIFYNLYQVLFEKCEEQGIRVVWGFTSAYKPFGKLGFEIPFEHQQSLLVNKILPAYRYITGLNKNNKTSDQLKILGLCSYSKLKRILARTKKAPNRFSVIVDEQITEGIQVINQSNLNDVDCTFSINQIPEFQKWRIYDNPNYVQTSTYGFRDEDKILKGLIVANITKEKVAYICQSSFHKELRQNDIQLMLGHAINELFKAGIVLIRNWHFCNNEYNCSEIDNYRNAGFIVLDKGIGMVWKKLGSTSLDANEFCLSRIATQGTL